MSEPAVQINVPVEPRPVGFVEPTREQAAAAMAALRNRRLPEAEKHITSIPDALMADRAWKLLLRGLAAIERGALDEAQAMLLQAAGLALIIGLGDEGAFAADMLRLAARAFRHVGWIYRRQDQPEQAYQTHMTAWRLRERHGSHEEIWDTACELGLDADVAQRWEEAERWHRAAIDAGNRSAENSERKLAIAWGNLATSLTESEQYEEGVEAARQARTFWRKHDIGAVTAAQADLKLGTALLKLAASVQERGHSLESSVLNEAVESLTTAHQELLAFGPEYTAYARSCLEQKELADRLHAAVTP